MNATIDRIRAEVEGHPVVLFGIGPAFVFLLQHRLPPEITRATWRDWLSALGTNAAIALLILAAIWFGAWPVRYRA